MVFILFDNFEGTRTLEYFVVIHIVIVFAEQKLGMLRILLRLDVVEFHLHLVFLLFDEVGWSRSRWVVHCHVDQLIILRDKVVFLHQNL